MGTLRSLPVRVLLALKSLRKREDGQAMVEYALILFLVSIVSVSILSAFGHHVSALYSDVAKDI